MDQRDKTIVIDDLMRDYYSYIFRLAFSILDDRDEAEDATQETFIRTAAHITDFKGNSEVKTWLSAITINVCRGELRKRRTRSRVKNTLQVIQSPFSKIVEPEDQVILNDLHSRLRNSLARLDEKHRLPVVMHYVHHMSVTQIACIMDTNENTIYSRLFNARRKLASVLKEVNQPDRDSLGRNDCEE
jgi:RNA polymerase sigma-70 factor, ECF subfamily